MQISVQQVGKRFNREWIFRDLSYEFLPGKKYALTGSNGSGKSTLLQVLMGSLLHSEGTLQYSDESNNKIEEPYSFVTMAAPYLELIEEMTATEFLSFHLSFKTLTCSIPELLETVQLQKAANKQIRYFSSGMKQRLKIGQAFFSDTPALFLDEPTTNLDIEGVQLYARLIEYHTHNRLVIIASNDKQEYHFCDEQISILDYK
ncbi:MAG: ABC transporter ATP-binding protein [Niastella sp.]|nr:ABC transporter ATP-binding protein [Niastella sp.]